MPLNELKARLDIKELPAEDKNRYNTLAGLLMYVLGQLPTQGQVIRLAGWQFDVVGLEGRRIDKVLAKPIADGPSKTQLTASAG
jgi:putative hemolysin